MIPKFLRVLSLVLCYIVAALFIVPWLMMSMVFYLIYVLYMIGTCKSEEDFEHKLANFSWSNRLIKIQVLPDWILENWEREDPRAAKYRCGECGKRGLRLKSIKGKIFPYPYRDLDVEVKVDTYLFTCECGNYIMRAGDAKRIDKAIEKSVQMIYGKED